MTRLLTTREVSELLGLSTETILRYARRGDLPSIRLSSGAIRFSEEALSEWVRAHERATRVEG
jgi:excisionase family DNA binding protein